MFINSNTYHYKIMKLFFIGILSLIIMFTGVCEVQGEKTGIQINEIQFSSSRIFTSRELSELSCDYEGKMVDINELKELLRSINKIYSERGYVTARAVLPEQRVENGVVKIELIEGSIDKIMLRGNDTTRNSYILNRFPYTAGDIIKLDRLEEGLYYFNATNDFRLKVDLKAGEEYGTTDLILKSEEPKKYQGRVFVDNAGREETGLYRCGLSFTDNSFTKNRDNLNLTIYGGEGLQAGTFSYSLPVSRRGTRLLLNYNKNAADIIAGEYKDVDIGSDYEAYSLGFTHPLIVKSGFKVDSSIHYSNKVSDTYFSGVNLLTSGVETYSLGLTAFSQSNNKSWYTRHIILRGQANAGKDDYHDPGLVDEFSKYSCYFQNDRQFRDGSILSFKTYLQLTDNNLLPSSEQFSLGGMSTVRAYEEGKLSGDQGYFLTLELSKYINEKIKFLFFIDHGGVYPYKGNEEDINKEDYLTGAGIGYTIQLTEQLSTKFVLGLPFYRNEDPRIHFAAEWSW